MTRLANYLHQLAHWLDPNPPCSCTLKAYQAGWRARRDSEERRARLLREEGVPGGLLEQAKRLNPDRPEVTFPQKTEALMSLWDALEEDLPEEAA